MYVKMIYMIPIIKSQLLIFEGIQSNINTYYKRNRLIPRSKFGYVKHSWPTLHEKGERISKNVSNFKSRSFGKSNSQR